MPGWQSSQEPIRPGRRHRRGRGLRQKIVLREKITRAEIFDNEKMRLLFFAEKHPGQKLFSQLSELQISTRLWLPFL